MTDMNRRSFLGGLAGAAAAAPAGPLRIAFLGASYSHARGKLDLIRQSDRWDLAGVWEPNAEVAAGLQAQGIRLLDRDRLLADPSITVVAVEGDTNDNAPHALLALEAGKHVHLEKPPARTMAEFRALVAAAERRRLVLQVGYMWRYNPAIQAAIDAARNRWLGDVYLVRATMNTLVAAEARTAWARFRGGQMFEQGCHLTDMVVRTLGRPDRVTPILRKHGPHTDTLADNTLAVFEYPRALALVTGATLQTGAGPYRSFEIFGSNGVAVVRPLEPPELSIDLAEAAGPYRKGPQKPPVPEYRRFVDEFVALAGAVTGVRPLPFSMALELDIQETFLRACEMPV